VSKGSLPNGGATPSFDMLAAPAVEFCLGADSVGAGRKRRLHRLHARVMIIKLFGQSIRVIALLPPMGFQGSQKKKSAKCHFSAFPHERQNPLQDIDNPAYHLVHIASAWTTKPTADS